MPILVPNHIPKTIVIHRIYALGITIGFRSTSG